MAEPKILFLCRRDALADNQSKGFELARQPVFAVRKRGQVYAYHNRCPHRGLPLNWMPDQFLDWDRELIQCTAHGAWFRIENGLCVAGPCPGKHLRPLPLIERDDELWVEAEALAEEPSGL